MPEGRPASLRPQNLHGSHATRRGGGNSCVTASPNQWIQVQNLGDHARPALMAKRIHNIGHSLLAEFVPGTVREDPWQRRTSYCYADETTAYLDLIFEQVTCADDESCSRTWHAGSDISCRCPEKPVHSPAKPYLRHIIVQPWAQSKHISGRCNRSPRSLSCERGALRVNAV